MTEEYVIPDVQIYGSLLDEIHVRPVQISGSFLEKLDEIYIHPEPLPATINVVTPDYDSDHELFFKFPSDFIEDPDSPYSFLPQSYHGGNDSEQRLRYYNLFKTRQDEAKVISDKEQNVVNKAKADISIIQAKAEWKALVTNKNILMADCNQRIAEAKRKLTFCLLYTSPSPRDRS